MNLSKRQPDGAEAQLSKPSWKSVQILTLKDTICQADLRFKQTRLIITHVIFQPFIITVERILSCQQGYKSVIKANGSL